MVLGGIFENKPECGRNGVGSASSAGSANHQFSPIFCQLLLGRFSLILGRFDGGNEENGGPGSKMGLYVRRGCRGRRGMLLMSKCKKASSRTLPSRTGTAASTTVPAVAGTPVTMLALQCMRP